MQGKPVMVPYLVFTFSLSELQCIGGHGDSVLISSIAITE